MTLSDRTALPAFYQVFSRVFPRNSNTHWLSIAAMLADVAFETDPFGRFTAFGRNTVLGIPASRLLGDDISRFCRLLSGKVPAGNYMSIFATLSMQSLAWRGMVAVTRADGQEGTYQMFLAPKPAEEGGKARRQAGRENTISGAYGLLIDMNASETLGGGGRAGGMLDPQTGLWTAKAFAEEAARRFDRLDVEGLPGTLLLLGFARTPAIGHHAVADRLVQELRDVCRPTDILGRIDATTFALWCDGMDDLTGAERAARFCQRLPAALPGSPCISVGLVARWPGSLEEPQTLIQQAGQALQQADQVAQAAADAGSAEPVRYGTWRVWNAQF